jgi:hypothetical protein
MKVVINACFGGFSLSPQGVKAYADRKGWPCYFFVLDGGFLGPHKRITDEEAFASAGLFGLSAYKVATVEELPPEQDNWQAMSMDERQASNKAWDEISISYYDIPRNDPDLVAVVESIGDAANGPCAKLRVVEIPDGTEWTVEEYDGNEHVAEAHRTWP